MLQETNAPDHIRAKTARSKTTYYRAKIPIHKKPQECHLKKLKRTMLIFSLWQHKWT